MPVSHRCHMIMMRVTDKIKVGRAKLRDLSIRDSQLNELRFSKSDGMAETERISCKEIKKQTDRH